MLFLAKNMSMIKHFFRSVFSLSIVINLVSLFILFLKDDEVMFIVLYLDLYFFLLFVIPCSIILVVIEIKQYSRRRTITTVLEFKILAMAFLSYLFLNGMFYLLSIYNVIG